MSLEEISKTTGLTLDEIENIKKNSKAALMQPYCFLNLKPPQNTLKPTYDKNTHFIE